MRSAKCRSGLASRCTAALFVFFTSGAVWSQADPPSDHIIMRTAQDVASLRAVLLDPGAGEALKSLCATMTLRSVAARTAEAPEGEACTIEGQPDGKTVHTFRFSDRRGSSSRVLVLEYSTCRDGAGAYRTQFERQYFSSVYTTQSTQPVVEDVAGFLIYFELFRNSAVSDQLTALAGSGPIGSTQLWFLARDESTGKLRYRFDVSAPPQSPGVPPEPLASWELLYDPASRTVELR